MALPEEDLGPAWLRDWAHIEADITAMEDFAAKLRAEVEVNYAPHASKVHEDMMTRLPAPSAGFSELVALLKTHQASQQATSDLVHHYANATGGMAEAASQIGRQYGQADAFSAARVTDVRDALDASGVTAPAAPGTLPPGSVPPGTVPPGTVPPGTAPVTAPTGTTNPTGGS
ncbi:MAG TPA: hypothetical protein VFR67_10030 [Pilimelia sp.]|nr:hypothetical protein [Pilimelia sp.]